MLYYKIIENSVFNNGVINSNSIEYTLVDIDNERSTCNPNCLGSYVMQFD